MIEVTHLQRYPVEGNHSVERIFEDVRRYAPPDIDIEVSINSYPSSGMTPRLRDAWRARDAKGIRHITGDTHYLAWFLPRKGTILTILDCVTLERLDGAKRRVFQRLWYDIPIRHAERITTISTFSAESIERHTGYPAAQIAIIPPALSMEFRRDDRPFNAGRPRILQVGTSENKNLARVAEAIQGVDVELAVIGRLSPVQAQMLHGRGIAFENRVNISREDLLEEYRRADIVMFASLYEGFGMPIIEAQAIGRPVITSNRCSMPEAAGDGALLVDPETVDAIRAALLRIVSDENYRNELVQRAFSNAMRYSPERIAADYAAIYREVATAGERVQ